MPHAPSYTHTRTRTPTPTHPCSRTRARAPAGHVRSQARPHLCPSTLCTRTRSASAHPRTRSPSRTHTDRPVVNGRACSGPSRRPPGTGSLRPSPSTVPDPPTGSPRILGDPARVLSRLRPLARGQRWSGPRTYPGQVRCLDRPLAVPCVRLCGVPSPPPPQCVWTVFVREISLAVFGYLKSSQNLK